MTKQRALCIGLDAAEWTVLERFIESGDMPNLGKLAATSTRVRMRTPEMHKAEGRWAEFLTGKTAAEAQYWSVVDFDPTTYRPFYGRSVQGTYFYARPDLTTVAFDVANSVLVEDVHGVQVTGWGSNHPQFPTASRPSSLIHEIDTRFGVNEAMRSDSHHASHSDEYLDNLERAQITSLRQRGEIIKWLDAQRDDWDLFLTVISEVHVALHLFMHAVDERHPLHTHPRVPGLLERLRRILHETDELIGELVAHFGDRATVVPFALHGMEPNDTDMTASVLLPELLQRQCFGEPLLDFPRWHPRDPYIELPSRLLDRHYLEPLLVRRAPVTRTGLNGLATRALRQFRRRLPAERLNGFERRLWRRPNWWEMDVRDVAPPGPRDVYAEAARKELEFVVAVCWYRDRWAEMPYFVLPSFSECHIRVNLEGRERAGFVPVTDYASTLDRIEADLRRIVNPRTGNPLIADVHRPRLDDPLAEIAPNPDLVLTFTEVADVIEHPEIGIVGQAPMMRAGQHSRNAWALLPNGRSAEVSDTVYEPRDFAATVIDLLGRPPLPTVTGRSFADEARPAS